MANLRRHFNFSTKPSVHQDREMPFPVSASTKPSYQQFDTHSLMNDICNCLDLCCSYIQALNSLCGAGSLLARNLFHAVQDVPAYRGISQQFLSVWEEVSKATAGASAAVKTETLMMLQEILNTLEMRSGEADLDDTIAESFQVIGTCLCSFIELQAQFSWSTWKSLSKLSKNFNSDSFRHSLQWRSPDRNPSKISINANLNANIKKHFSQLFCKVGVSKVSESSDNTQSHFYTSPVQTAGDMPFYSHFGSQNIPGNSTKVSTWSPTPAVWSSTDCTESKFVTPVQTSEQDCENSVSTNTGLDEVINLLSCVPVQQSNNKLNSSDQNYFSYSPTEQMYRLIPKGSTSVSRNFNANHSWSKGPRDIALGYDSWIWRVDNMNCFGSPSGSDVLKKPLEGNNKLLAQWENKELQKWNSAVCETGSSSDEGSSVHGPETESSSMNRSFNRNLLTSLSSRWHNNGESMPGGLESVSESKDEYLWEVRSKISTW
ncbi:hypothetical protein X975_15578, partial [Stegodyphus mimosarum]